MSWAGPARLFVLSHFSIRCERVLLFLAGVRPPLLQSAVHGLDHERFLFFTPRTRSSVFVLFAHRAHSAKLDLPPVMEVYARHVVLATPTVST